MLIRWATQQDKPAWIALADNVVHTFGSPTMSTDKDFYDYMDETPTKVRIERLKEREYKHFGDRILPGQRSRALHTEWLKKINCPVITVDGTNATDEILKGLGLYDE